MSFLASNCYRIASKGPRTPLRAFVPESPAKARSTYVLEGLPNQRASLVLASGRCGTDASNKGSVEADHFIEARPSSLDRNCRKTSPFLTPPVSRRRSSCVESSTVWKNVEVDFSSRCPCYGCSAAMTTEEDDECPLSVSSQRHCEDFITALELYRQHLANVLGTQCRFKSATNCQIARPLSRLDADRFYHTDLKPQQLRPWVYNSHLRRLHTSALCRSSTSEEDEQKKDVVPFKQRLKNLPSSIKKAPAALRDWLVHMFHGFRLLAIDIWIASKLLFRILRGKTLTRREKKQLIRTVGDAFRLVPFLVFVIVPFMEFLLPIALKLFPNMLPSTFETEDKKREKQIKTLKAKVEMAKFLQATLKGSDDIEDSQATRVQDFLTFLKNAQTSGKPVRNEDILKYSALFENEITLDNLQRPQLIALCQLLELQPMGTNNFLRFQIRMQLRSLKADDRLIRKEGVDALAVWELQQANRSRGMKSLGLTEGQLQNQLKQWLELHLDNKIPATLLLLSRIVYIGEATTVEAQLAGTMTKLTEQSSPLTQTIVQKEKEIKPTEVKEKIPIPEEVPEVETEEEVPIPATTIVTPVSAKEQSEPVVDAKTKIELLKQEEKRIKEEKKEEAAKKKEGVASAREDTETLKDPAPPEVDEPVMVDKAPTLETGIDAVDVASSLSDSTTEADQTEEQQLKEQLWIIKSQLQDVNVNETEGKSKKNLDRKVKRMIKGMDLIIKKLQQDRQKHAEMLKQKVDALETASFKELDAEQQQEVKDAMAESKQRVLTLDELVDVVNKIQTVPDKDRIAKIVELLDEDKDGTINQEDVMRVLDLIGRDNVLLSDKRMTEILRMVQKEMLSVEAEKNEIRLEGDGKVGSELLVEGQASPVGEVDSSATSATREESPKSTVKGNSSENNSTTEDEVAARKKQQRLI